jgi:hypothetical protein
MFFLFLLVSDIKYCEAKLEAKAKIPLTHQPQFNLLSINFFIDDRVPTAKFFKINDGATKRVHF